MVNPDKSTLRHIIARFLKLQTKQKSWKQCKRNDILPLGEKTIQMTQDLSSENMEARRRQHNIFQMLKKKKKIVNPEPYIHWKYLSWIKKKWRYFQMKEN